MNTATLNKLESLYIMFELVDFAITADMVKDLTQEEINWLEDEIVKNYHFISTQYMIFQQAIKDAGKSELSQGFLSLLEGSVERFRSSQKLLRKQEVK